MIAEGYTNKEIAEILSLSIKTVQSHRTNLMAKLDLHDRGDLIKYAIQKKIIDWLRTHGWFVIKFNDRFHHGIPDAYALKEGRSVWLEFKRPGAKTTKLQDYTIKQIRDHEGEVYVLEDPQDIKFLLEE